MLEHLCFKSSDTRSPADFVREIGENVAVTSGQEQLRFSIHVLRNNVDRGLALLADSET